MISCRGDDDDVVVGSGDISAPLHKRPSLHVTTSFGAVESDDGSSHGGDDEWLGLEEEEESLLPTRQLDTEETPLSQEGLLVSK